MILYRNQKRRGIRIYGGKNGIILQYFERYMDIPESLWNRIRIDAEQLGTLGITATWLPPAYKGFDGDKEVGYAVYDMYDLGEFNQKGTIPTKYGTKDEYLKAIENLKQNGIDVYADIVLNHKMGADGVEEIFANKCECYDRTKEGVLQKIKVYTKYNFPERGHKYSDFEWNWTHFYKEWLEYIRKDTKKELFTVGEYWTYKVDKLHKYLKDVDDSMSLFDVPLHDNLYRASTEWNFDMSRLLEGTFVKENPEKAVTFVDNHDTQPGQAIESFIERWMKQLEYSIILLRKDVYPCVFYGDLFGIEHSNTKPVDRIKTLMTLRKLRAYGKQYDYFDDQHVIGWTREGDNMYKNSGLAVVALNSKAAEKRRYIGTSFVGEKFIDCLDNCSEIITIDEDGFRRI